MADRARWLLVTPAGRLSLAIAYSIAATVSVVVYTIRYSVTYGIGQLVVTAFGLLWARWCLRRA